MREKLVIPLLIAITLTIIISVPMISENAFAKPSDLPDPAKATVAPLKAKIIEYEGITAVLQPYYTFPDNPDLHESTIGDGFEGTGKLIIARPDSPTGAVGCSGTLLTTGVHVLTAAHCLADGNGNSIWTAGIVEFNDGAVIKSFVSATIHPDYDGDLFRGNDIAVIELDSEVPIEVTRYDIDRNSRDDKGEIGEKVGYGVSGFFSTGVDPAYGFGTKRDGLNKYDDHADTMLQAIGLKPGKDFVRKSVLQYDSDNGNPTNDAFGFFFNKNDLGLGNQETNSAGGDSGGSTFVEDSNGNKLVTGVTSYGITLEYVGGGTSDCHLNLQPFLIDGQIVLLNVPDSSCGEFSADTSVAKYASFIDSVTGSGGDPSDEPNCPPNSKSPQCS